MIGRRYRKIVASDIDVAGVGDEVWLCVNTKRGEIDVVCDRDQIPVLVEMLIEAMDPPAAEYALPLPGESCTCHPDIISLCPVHDVAIDKSAASNGS